MKFGFDFNPVHDVVRSETFFGGRFQVGGRIPLGLLLPVLTGDPNAATTGLPELYQQGFGDLTGAPGSSGSLSLGRTQGRSDRTCC